MSMELQVVEKYVQRGLDEFNTNPLASQLLRRLAGEAPELFYKTATMHLSGEGESNALRMLAMLLLKQEHLFDRMVSPLHGTREGAVKLLKRLLAVDPSADVKFAKKLPGRTYWNQAHAFDTVRSTRALDILDETSRGRRLLPILGHLPESSDARIAAKATLFVGRRVQNPVWTKKQLDRGDERVRANAIEALWGVNTPPATRLLEDCIPDRNNRVVGNALVGLHIAGKEKARTELVAAARDGRPELRSTAAWAMGKIAIPEFTPHLTELIRDEHPKVRSSALRSLVLLKRLTKPAVPEQPGVPAPPPPPDIVAEAVERAANYLRIPSWASLPR